MSHYLNVSEWPQLFEKVQKEKSIHLFTFGAPYMQAWLINETPVHV